GLRPLPELRRGVTGDGSAIAEHRRWLGYRLSAFLEQRSGLADRRRSKSSRINAEFSGAEAFPATADARGGIAPAFLTVG
ncbi:MAG: hypothetical protein EBY09_19970, partial [Verrucomicrobia bacterium]|nr:hypothetical protein [Verrucomicrobiota bacterium]